MPYELRIAGRAEARFEEADQAEARAREILRANADTEVAIIDMATGRPYAPGADEGDRGGLAHKIGF